MNTVHEKKEIQIGCKPRERCINSLIREAQVKTVRKTILSTELTEVRRCDTLCWRRRRERRRVGVQTGKACTIPVTIINTHVLWCSEDLLGIYPTHGLAQAWKDVYIRHHMFLLKAKVWKPSKSPPKGLVKHVTVHPRSRMPCGHWTRFSKLLMHCCWVRLQDTFRLKSTAHNSTCRMLTIGGRVRGKTAKAKYVYVHAHVCFMEKISPGDFMTYG